MSTETRVFTHALPRCSGLGPTAALAEGTKKPELAEISWIYDVQDYAGRRNKPLQMLKVSSIIL